MTDPDADIRLDAFRGLRDAALAYGGAMPWSAISAGFKARGRTWCLASKVEGIFRPAGMTGLLSVKTVVPKPKGKIWYHDQAGAEVGGDAEMLSYAFTGENPNSVRNQWLRDAMERELPIIYFFGVAPAVYEPLFPAFIVDWDPVRLRCGLAFAPGVMSARAIMPPERRYALRVVQKRLHQAAFRERVLAAYGGRCALSGLPEARLIDAAHIVSDQDEELGQPDIRNGICMSKIHHAAYDAGLVGIDPDLRIHVSGFLLRMNGGPMLEQGVKALHGTLLRTPASSNDAPDRDRLAVRFASFQQ